MRALIVSLGSIGRRHLANLRSLRPDCEIGVLRERAREPEPDGVDRVFKSLDEALAFEPEIAIVAGPASRHTEISLPLAEAEVHLFIEKPISNRLDGVDTLIQCCHERGSVLMVGYVLRFHPAIERARAELDAGRIGRVIGFRAEVGQHLERWRPGTDYRESVSARAELGGGVLLELSHELDLARWLCGDVDRVAALTGSLGGLDIDVEDSAEILLRFRTQALGSLHLDMWQRPAVRRCVLLGERGRLEVDLLDGRLVCHDDGETQCLPVPHGLDRNELYRRELDHFLECVASGAEPLVTGEDGRAALALALAARRSAQDGVEVPP